MQLYITFPQGSIIIIGTMIIITIATTFISIYVYVYLYTQIYTYRIRENVYMFFKIC